MILSVSNDITKQQGIQQTYVSSAISAGGTASPVKNIDGFTNQWAIQLGQTGEETAEIMIVSGVPSGTTLNFGTSPAHTAGTLFFSHAQDTPIYQLHYDQVVFSRSTAGTVGPFSALSTVNIQPDSLYTTYNDQNGAATYAYFTQYYNSVTTDLSGSSSIFIPGGPTFYSYQKLKQRVKDKLYSAGYIRDDTLIGDWVNEWYEIMTNAALKVNQNYMLGTVGIGFGTAGFGTVTSTDFKQPIKFEISYDNGVTYTASREMPFQQFSAFDFFSPNDPIHSWLGETVFQILPASTGGSVRLTYGQRFSPLVNDADELTQTLKAYTTSCVEYALSVAYGLDQKDAESQQHYQLYGQGKADFISEVQPRDLSTEKNINLVEGLTGMHEAMDISGDIVF